jgi:hypothetical protein
MSGLKKGLITAWAWGPRKITRSIPRLRFLCLDGRYIHVSPVTSKSHARIIRTSPGRIPVSSCSSTMARTGGSMNGSVAATTVSATGMIGSVSRASPRPRCSPGIVRRASESFVDGRG